MKKLFTILLLTIGFSLNAQYYSITYVNVPPENQAEFASIETTYWSKVAQAAIDAGKQSAWGLVAAVGGVPNGWTHAFVNVYETAEDLANAATNWDPESVLGIESSLLNTVELTDGGFNFQNWAVQTVGLKLNNRSQNLSTVMTWDRYPSLADALEALNSYGGQLPRQSKMLEYDPDGWTAQVIVADVMWVD